MKNPFFQRVSFLTVNIQDVVKHFYSKKFNLVNALEKYKFLKATAPTMFNRAKLGHIASIMGVTPETLSRIRNQL